MGRRENVETWNKSPVNYSEELRRRKFARMDSDSEVDDRFATAAGESEEGSEEEEEDEIETPKKRKMDSRKRLDSETQEKKKKPGVIYLSSVPDGMNVTQTTAFFSEFGRVGRVFLQPDKTDKQKGKFNRVFSEGWVEFASKKVARMAAERLNCQPVGGKRKSKAHDQTWNIKYLPRFKWVHLSERLAYEAAVRQQRLRTEISQVKREAEHFKSSVESGKRKRSRGSKDSASAAGGAVEQVATVQKPFVFQQKETEAQIRKRKMVEEVNTSSGIEPEVKKKKLKKKKESEKAAAEKSKSKKGKKLQQETKSSKVRSKEGGERSALLKSVFSGGGGS